MDYNTSMIIIAVSGILFAFIDVVSGAMLKRGVFTINEFGVNVLSFCNFLGIRFVMSSFWALVLFGVFGAYQGMLANVAFWIAFPAYVLIEEYIHYWVHRYSHSAPWLWRIHKPHHVPEHVNLSVAYRENWLWFVLLPNPLLTGFMVWAGQPEAAFIATAWKGSFEFMVHSRTRWDLPLHNFWLTKPIMRVLEKIITLQDTHHAHHGTGRYGHGMCNFGSFLFIFDVLHGTGEFPRCQQDAYGVPRNVKVEPWYEQLWWPMAKGAAQADLKPPSAEESRGTRTFTDVNGRFSIVM